MANPGEIAAQIATLRAISARLRHRLEISREQLAATDAVLKRSDPPIIGGQMSEDLTMERQDGEEETPDGAERRREIAGSVAKSAMGRGDTSAASCQAARANSPVRKEV